MFLFLIEKNVDKTWRSENILSVLDLLLIFLFLEQREENSLIYKLQSTSHS
jgi:hypothetical protein